MFGTRVGVMMYEDSVGKIIGKEHDNKTKERHTTHTTSTNTFPTIFPYKASPEPPIAKACFAYHANPKNAHNNNNAADLTLFFRGSASFKLTT